MPQSRLQFEVLTSHLFGERNQLLYCCENRTFISPDRQDDTDGKVSKEVY